MSKSHLNPFEFDARMIEWNLRHNVISKDKLKSYLESLPDEAANSELIHIEEDDMDTAGLTEQ